MTMSARRTLGGWAAALSLLAGCGNSTPPPKAATEDVAPQRARGGPVPEVSAEIGALDEDAVTRTFAASLGSLQRCLEAGARRVEYLGGSVGFALEIDQSGALADARVSESTLGSLETEQCMLDALRKQSWPKPVGGKKGLAGKSFDFEPPSDVRAPTEWSSDRVDDTLSKLSSKIASCKESAGGSFTATVYVDTSGKALSVGLAWSERGGEEAVECLAALLREATYPSPGSWPAKVSFSL
ncbi:MAG: AgmX/PglI C-terminal domain-containing protein [Sorangiineae bacterium]|nr:AgmX/PglI C-terminal domain-containing protein [Polyangiaceae bacterium]MEB2323272.1 AgmX/PglI C-terminal domain-containing protein [Sorangiineae bacterium]